MAKLTENHAASGRTNELIELEEELAMMKDRNDETHQNLKIELTMTLVKELKSTILNMENEIQYLITDLIQKNKVVDCLLQHNRSKKMEKDIN